MSSLLEVFKYTNPYKKKLFLIILLMIISMILSNIQPLFFGKLIDFISLKDMDNSTKTIIFISIIFLLNLTFKIIQRYSLAKLTNYIQIDIKLKMIESIMKTEMDEYNSIQKGELMNKLENDAKSFSNILAELLKIVIDFMSIVIVFLILIKINILLAAILVITGPLTILVFKFYGTKIRKKDVGLKTKMDDYFTYIGELLSSFKLFKILNNEIEGVNKFHQKNISYYNLVLDKIILNLKSNSITELLNFSSYILVLILGIYLIFEGKLTIGDLVAFNSYSNNFTQYLLKFSQLNIIVQETIVSMNRVKNIIDRNRHIYKIENFIENSLELTTSSQLEGGEIVLSNVDYRHSDNDYILQNINIRIPLKKVVLIKGGSGTGKTTLLNILAGLFVRYSGNIFIGNKNIRDIPKEIFKKQVCLVSQDHFLLSATIRENLLMAKPEATEEELINVCKMVNIYSFIETLKHNFDTQIGHNGLQLSIGQKQRISIARALLRDTDIYLFDEITSSLDKENQAYIHSLIKFLNKEKEKTIIMVTHDLNFNNEVDLYFEVNEKQVREIQLSEV